MTISRWMGTIAIVSLLGSACSAAGTENSPEAGDESVATAQADLDVGDMTNNICFDAPDPAHCALHDGVHVYSSGQCTIKVRQQCSYVGGQCRCTVRVIATHGPCDDKGWGAFFNHC